MEKINYLLTRINLFNNVPRIAAIQQRKQLDKWFYHKNKSQICLITYNNALSLVNSLDLNFYTEDVQHKFFFYEHDPWGIVNFEILVWLSDHYKGIPSHTSLIMIIERFTPLNFLAAFAHFEDLVPANTSFTK